MLDFRPPLAVSGFVVAYIVVRAIRFAAKATKAEEPRCELEPDLPIPENGEDLLSRQDTIDGLISTLLLEEPTVIAVTGTYGDGKTSLLNLTIGKLKKLDESELPIIVRFSPWLAGNSNTLVLFLLNSIVAAIKERYVAPGLGRDAFQYARALTTVIPKAERLKDLFAEPSQEIQITTLATRIAETPRRVLVVLDDLDRMEAKELETVFKLLRGSDNLSNVTFLCSFDIDELALILKTTRRHQDTRKFIEKFFPVQFPLPKIESMELQQFLFKRFTAFWPVRSDDASRKELEKTFEHLWQDGAGLYFSNLRRIKLFLNRIRHSLERLADEINIGDFLRLELIRDIAPTIYEYIYQHPEYFYNSEFAFEFRFRSSLSIDDKESDKQRAAFYEEMIASTPNDKKYALRILEELFPHFAKYHKRVVLPKAVDAVEAEIDKRIFHPRCFRQYFMLKVPAELFSQKDFNQFASSIRNSGEENAVKQFNQVFQRMLKEDFKRYHFMHRIDSTFDEFELPSAQGLCRGMAQNSPHWSADAFEFIIAVRSTRRTYEKIADAVERKGFLQTIMQESASSLYMLSVIWWLIDMFQKGGKQSLQDEIERTKPFAAELLRAKYLVPNAPSVFEEFKREGISKTQNIDPNQFQFAWRKLGTDAEADQKKYLRDLLSRDPKNLDEFLSLMFRVAFIDDYSALKPLIDYKELSELIMLNEDTLDKSNVEHFRKRYDADRSEGNAPVPAS